MQWILLQLILIKISFKKYKKLEFYSQKKHFMKIKMLLLNKKISLKENSQVLQNLIGLAN